MNKKAIITLVLLIAAITVCVMSTLKQDVHGKIALIHTVSYSNVAAFETLRQHPDRIENKFIPDPAKHPESLLAESKNACAVSVTPFANALIAAQKDPSLRIIAGSGLNGISMIAREAATAAELKGKRIGTSKGDSLEVFAIELMDKAGIPLGSYKLVYFSDPFEAIEAIKAGKIDAVTHVEPFATALVDDNGMKRVATSEQLWGTHPDAVLLTAEASLTKCHAELEWLVKSLKQSEDEINKAPEKAAENLAKSFYNMPADKLLRILQQQKPRIDIREYQGFFTQRYETLKRIKYVDGPMRSDIFDWSLLK